jgi:hypothetical protein
MDLEDLRGRLDPTHYVFGILGFIVGALAMWLGMR